MSWQGKLWIPNGAPSCVSLLLDCCAARANEQRSYNFFEAFDHSPLKITNALYQLTLTTYWVLAKSTRPSFILEQVMPSGPLPVAWIYSQRKSPKLPKALTTQQACKATVFTSNRKNSCWSEQMTEASTVDMTRKVLSVSEPNKQFWLLITHQVSKPVKPPRLSNN